MCPSWFSFNSSDLLFVFTLSFYIADFSHCVVKMFWEFCGIKLCAFMNINPILVIQFKAHYHCFSPCTMSIITTLGWSFFTFQPFRDKAVDLSKLLLYVLHCTVCEVVLNLLHCMNQLIFPPFFPFSIVFSYKSVLFIWYIDNILSPFSQIYNIC